MVQEPKTGTRFAERFELRTLVAQTPAYVEYRALDGEVGVEVALWWMRPGLVADPARQEQWMGAAVELRRFSHASVRKLHGAGHAGGTAWATWQLSTSRGPAPTRGDAIELPSIVRWIDAVTAALGALHAIGIVHGRLLADDVVVVSGELKLGGAGVLRAIEPQAALRAWSRHLGYVAPELRAGHAPTAGADAWSIAAIAASMMAGTDGADDAMRVIAKRHPPLHDLFAGVLGAPAERREAIDLKAFAAQARERAKMPYLADDRTGPMRAIRAGVLAAAAPPPAAKPFKAGRAKGPTEKLGSGSSAARIAAHDEPTQIDPRQQQPESFTLPTPTSAPPAPVQQPPAVAIQTGPPPPAPAPAPPAPELTPEPSQRVPRARTAPPVGGFQVVSMKPADARPPAADAQASGKPASARVKKPRLRAISEGQQRSFSTKAGALGYLAPPKEIAEQYRRAARRRLVMTIVVALLLVCAAVGGYLIATHA